MAYYNPNAILTDAQKVPLTFDLAVPRLSPLNNGSEITNGTKLDLPLWMAELLAVSKPAAEPLGSLEMPSALGQRVLNALKADPKSVDLRAQAQFFYGLGERMLDLFEEEEMGEVLSDVSLSSLIVCVLNANITRHSRSGHWKSQTKRRIRGQRSKGTVATTSWAVLTRPNGSVSATASYAEIEADDVPVFRAAHDGSNAVKKWFESTSRI